MSVPNGSAIRALSLEYKSLETEPVEGFRVKLVDDNNLFEWAVVIFGPPMTLYQGGYFKVSRSFPHMLKLIYSRLFNYSVFMLFTTFTNTELTFYCTL